MDFKLGWERNQFQQFSSIQKKEGKEGEGKENTKLRKTIDQTRKKKSKAGKYKTRMRKNVSDVHSKTRRKEGRRGIKYYRIHTGGN